MRRRRPRWLRILRQQGPLLPSRRRSIGRPRSFAVSDRGPIHSTSPGGGLWWSRGRGLSGRGLNFLDDLFDGCVGADEVSERYNSDQLFLAAEDEDALNLPRGHLLSGFVDRLVLEAPLDLACHGIS